MSIKKVINEERVIFQDNGQNVAEITAQLRGGTIAMKLKGSLRSDIEAYLQNELNFYAVSGIPQIEVDCSGIDGIAPGCYLELMKLKSEFVCRNRQADFINKSEAFLEFEKKHGKVL